MRTSEIYMGARVTEPAQKPFRSRQDYGTPPLFIRAVKQRLRVDRFAHDFAADATNRQAPTHFDQEADALSVPQWELSLRQNGCPTSGQNWGWLNPPFTAISKWAKRCAETGEAGGKIAFLVPAAVGSNWFRDYVAGRAMVLFLNGRITFVGQTDPYPKDCMLCLYGVDTGYDVWNWRAGGS